MSIFNEMMSDAQEVMVDVLGERDAHGDFAKAKMTRKSAPYELDIFGGSVGAVQVAEVEKENGGIVKRETVSFGFARPKELTQIERSATFIIPSTGEGVWVPQQTGSTITATWVNYQLERMPLAEMDGKRDARTV